MDRITKSDVRYEFRYMRQLMRHADRLMRTDATHYALGSEIEQLSLELAASAERLHEYVEYEIAKRNNR